MLRRALLLAFALFLVQETELGSFFLGADCAESCPDDTSPGHCAPTCASCGCGTHLSPVAPPAVRLAAPAPRESRPSWAAARPGGDRHVGDILHVPRTALA